METTQEDLGMKRQEVQQTASLPSLTTKKQRRDQVIRLTEDCFKIQEHYGMKPDELKVLMKAMVEDLQDQDPSNVRAAFVKWRKTSPKIPRPSHILDLIEVILAENRTTKRFCDFDGDWSAYKEYLEGGA